MTLLLLALLATGKWNTSTINVKLQVVEAQRLDGDVVLLDEELGAYRVELAFYGTGSIYRDDKARYLLFTNGDVEEAWVVTMIDGIVYYAFHEDAFVFEFEGYSDDELMAWVDEQREPLEVLVQR